MAPDLPRQKLLIDVRPWGLTLNFAAICANWLHKFHTFAAKVARLDADFAQRVDDIRVKSDGARLSWPPFIPLALQSGE